MASLALLALAAPSAFAVFCASDAAAHSHSKAQPGSESHHHDTGHESNSSDSHHGSHGDQDEPSDNCCQRLIGSGSDLVAAITLGIWIPAYADSPAVLPAEAVVGVLSSQTIVAGFFGSDSGPPRAGPPSSSLGRAPPVLFA